MKKIVSLFHEEDGAAEMLQVVTLLGFTAIVTVCLLTMNEWVGGSNWGEGKKKEGWVRPLVSKILTDGTGGTGNNETIDIDQIDPDDLVDTTLHLSDSSDLGNTCEDTTNDDATPSDNMIVVKEKRRGSVPDCVYEASVVIKLDRDDEWLSENVKDYSWKIEKVSSMFPASNWNNNNLRGTFTGDSTVTLQWCRPHYDWSFKESEEAQSFFAVRSENSSGGGKRMLKVKVQHGW